jgi:amino acid transporter
LDDPYRHDRDPVPDQHGRPVLAVCAIRGLVRQFTGKAFGPSVGATVAVFTNFGYIVLASALVAIAGAWVAETLKTFLAISLPWAAITVLTSLAIGWLVTRGVELSAFWAGVFFYFEGGLLALGAVTMLITHATFLTPAPFLFSNLAGGLVGLGAGFPLAVFLFIGWESSAPLAEETETPRRNIPRALIASTLSIGLLYVFLAYATAVGLNMDAHLLGASQIPFIDALRASAPTLLIVAYLAGITSIVSALIAGSNSFPRVLFNCGREGLLPKFLGKIHPRHRTPHVAIWASLVIAVSITLGFGLLGGVAPLDYFGFAGTLGTTPSS